MLTLVPEGLPRLEAIRMDALVVGFTMRRAADGVGGRGTGTGFVTSGSGVATAQRHPEAECSDAARWWWHRLRWR